MNVTELNERIHINLPKDKVSDIIFHSSYQPQDPDLLKRNKEYISWGRTIIYAAYAIYTYRNELSLTSADLSKKINNFYRRTVERIYEVYSLEDFVIKGKGELRAKHPDITAKLIVVIYQEYGFVKVYNFLKPFFENATQNKIVDYKTLIQEYAQARKLTPVYKILNKTGPDHELLYTCQLVVGKQIVTASEIGKKRAEKEAAKAFASKYKVNPLKQKRIKRNESVPLHQLSVYRKNQLDNAMKLLEIKDEFIQYNQLDEVFTHSSYVNENQKLNLISNDCLCVVGAHIFQMLCGDYIFENYNMENVSLVEERSVLLKEDNLAKALPGTITDYLRRSRNVDLRNNSRVSVRLRIDILKAILAALWINYSISSNAKIEAFARMFAYKCFSKSSDEKILDYRSFLQTIVQRFGFSYSDECVALEDGTEHIPVFAVSVKITGVDWSVESHGYGGNKKTARNNAAKDMLPLILAHCTGNVEIKQAINRMLDPEMLSLYEERKKDQKVLGISLPVADSIPSIKVKTKAENKTPEAIKLANTSKQKTGIPAEVSFDGSEYVLYICKGTITCRKNDHHIVSVTGILVSLSGRQIRINVNYCIDCNLFFINYSEYKYYRDIYGALLGNFSVRKYHGYSESGYNGLAEESILRICGYTVNQADGLTSHQRQLILANMMDRNIISKYRIIEYLQFFINNSRYRYNMRLANKKWSDDLQWVREYRVDKQRHFVIDSIKKYR